MNNQIKERPILFNSATVIAILEGRKTQTRRMINPQPELTSRSGFSWKGESFGQNSDFEGTCRNFSKGACKFGKPGDRLWVRETFLQDSNGYIYRADGDFEGNAKILGGWRPSLFMPRSASRILLEITNVRVERLQDISEEDAKSEGADPVIEFGYSRCYSIGFNRLWESINGQGSWALNPWVWVIEFKVI